MGCTASKDTINENVITDSLYAPVTRTLSEPIHYPAENEDDSCHVVSLTSSSYGIIKMDRPGEHANSGSFLQLIKDKNLQDIQYTSPSPKLCNAVKIRRKLNRVEESPEASKLETINTWELMEGLNEDGIGRTPSPLRSTAKCGPVSKSASFNMIRGFDSSCTELSSWKKYYSGDHGEEKHRYGNRRNGVRQHLNFKDQEHNGYQHLSPIKSPALASPSLMKNSEMGSNSPLFDPSLMATFEKALTTGTAGENDWLNRVPSGESDWLARVSNGSCMTTNSSIASSDNPIWTSSDSSSEGDSPKQNPKQMLDKVSSWNDEVQQSREDQRKLSKHDELKLSKDEFERFEYQCPPRGEEKVVFYFTSLRCIRKTYEDCCDMKIILQGLGIHVDERDIWMHSKFREELTSLMDNAKLQVPRLFIRGRYIGGIETVKRLHEDGVLFRLVKDMPTRDTCEACGDLRFIPCLTCSGSCKVIDESDTLSRCSKCNENGLIMCPLCS